MASRTRARINNLNDRAREVGQTDELSLDDINALKTFYDFTCLKCGAKPALSPDHVIPLASGGTNTVENLQLLCERCNKAKRAKSHDYRNGKILTREIADALLTKDKRHKHDWISLKSEYVTGTMSLREHAKNNGVSESQMLARAASEAWSEAREQYRINIVSNTQEKIQAQQVDAAFSAYLATFRLLRRSFDDYMFDPTPEKLRAIDGILNKGLVLEGYDTESKRATLKDWRDAAQQSGMNDSDIHKFASDAAADYFNSDSGSDRDAGAGWTD